ncbi:cysteine desulfurase family protein [Thalassobius sp. I31.1]|uniref:cysteine desulfurase family protein n=1 Tax=Thalassobius sp. I31.1 TaxID=2109912 RepID=UPI000D1AC49A|nr:cysteine desulfurase family protein [Thalassobius sp. I31.1]
MKRVYFDHNATTPLRPEARAAMLEAMDVFGNPSSVHSEGRVAKRMMEKARKQIASAFGADGAEIVFTSGATEAARLALICGGFAGADVEHDCVVAHLSDRLNVDENGGVEARTGCALQAANSETGVIQSGFEGAWFCDAVQIAGKMPWAFNWSGANTSALSAHKFGGPKGVGALVLRRGTDLPQPAQGGQEMGRRSGTENLIGIVGMGAAAEAASRDLEGETWARVEKLRIILENALEESAPDLIIAGKHANRLPNTSCFAVPGWKGETQVMQMDLAGFAVSAGSACSSGKVRESRVLRAMGYGPEIASSAIRVSLSPQNTEDEVLAFVAAWTQEYKRRKSRAA